MYVFPSDVVVHTVSKTLSQPYAAIRLGEACITSKNKNVVLIYNLVLVADVRYHYLDLIYRCRIRYHAKMGRLYTGRYFRTKYVHRRKCRWTSFHGTSLVSSDKTFPESQYSSWLTGIVISVGENGFMLLVSLVTLF